MAWHSLRAVFAYPLPRPIIFASVALALVVSRRLSPCCRLYVERPACHTLLVLISSPASKHAETPTAGAQDEGESAESPTYESVSIGRQSCSSRPGETQGQVPGQPFGCCTGLFRCLFPRPPHDPSCH
ncbi:hypothetical protein B0J15DRAFT_239495 [Fusarium solani]|uniref:Uncharacterized protein n=1 Tax=Fusarium solani TaxID=169388 RepID=A0A9P9HYS8_FUSSL|nr:uncharacterized protein B0J15DRAFT_239495 [Fusarium solani]KAH7266132.1 hypothetical protein B0J15DRAFT_239495 [Fusarium solani]